MNLSEQIQSPKTALIVGVANERSIAWAIAQSLHAQGYRLAFTYGSDNLERRVRPLAESVNAAFCVPCDVRNEGHLAELKSAVEAQFDGQLGGLLHCVAFADKQDLEGSFLQTSREGFLNALEVSCYSLVSLTRALEAPIKAAKQASILTLSYYGAEKVIPNYNVMGVAKAALEASVRYLANELGPDGIRVNALSAGPVRTLAAAGIKGFKSMMDVVQEKAPLRSNVTLEQVGETGAFLLSSKSSGITGETIYVDSGYHILGM